MDRKGIIAGLALGLVLTGGWATNAIAAPTQAGTAHSGQAMPAALRPAFYKALAEDTGEAHAINKTGCASLPRQKLKACFDADGAHFKGTTGLALRLTAWGRGNDLTALARVKPRIKGNHVAYRHGALTEWWRVLPMGFEQGFTIAKRPAGSGELTLALAASRQDAGAPSARHSRAGGNRVKTSPLIPLRPEGGKELAWGKLRYGKLVVTDANGKVVPATLKAKGDRILIAVNDANAAYPLTVDPLVWIREQKVTASDGAAGDEFGTAVSVQGTTALIGAPQGAIGPGAVYVFTYSQGHWSQTQKLVADDGQRDDYFGEAVALDGKTAFIGAPQVTDFSGNGGGALYIYTESNGTWVQTQEFWGYEPDLKVSALGRSIAVDGSTALIGAGEYDNEKGQAVIFTGSEGGAWAPSQIFSDGKTGDHFGQAVALDGTTALIGAPNDSRFDNGWQGAVYVYTASNGTWAPTATLVASDPAEYNFFGTAVAIAGGEALIGAPDHSHDGNGEGAVYVFANSGGNWSQTQELFADPLDRSMAFGTSIVTHGSLALVGAPGDGNRGQADVGAVFVLHESNGTWTQTVQLLGDITRQAEFGNAVAFDGTRALIGAWTDTVNDTFDVGSAYFFGFTNLDLAVSAPESVGQGANYVAQTIATNEASASSPAITAKMAVPKGASYVSATVTQGSCSEKKNVVTCDFGSIDGNAGTAKASVTFKATGEKGTTIENTASIVRSAPPLSASAATQIEAPNTPPVAKDGTLTTDENKAANGTLQASDPDGDPLSFIIVAKPKHGTVKLDDASKGTYTYTPDQGYSGADSFSFKANDGQADSNTAQVSITVNANQPPVAKDGTLTTKENKAASGTLQASDPDGDSLTFSIVAQPEHGKVTLDDPGSGAFTYTPDKNYSGADSFSFKASDGQANSNTAKVSITVKKVSSSGGGASAPLGLGLLALAAGLTLLLRRRRHAG